MKVVVDTSVLIAGSIFWECRIGNQIYRINEKGYSRCKDLFDFLKINNRLSIGIITKTVESQAKEVFNKAVVNALNSTFSKYGKPAFIKRFRFMELQDIISNESLDRMENTVEECSVRLSIDIEERERIINTELTPFFEEIVPKTTRYIEPKIPPYIKGLTREELREKMLETMPHGIIYKGMPDIKDMRVMAEAVYIKRNFDKDIFLVSLDNHFKPNPVHAGSFLSRNRKFLNKFDSTVRDELMKRFGFFGDEPSRILEKLKYRQLDN